MRPLLPFPRPPFRASDQTGILGRHGTGVRRVRLTGEVPVGLGVFSAKQVFIAHSRMEIWCRGPLNHIRCRGWSVSPPWNPKEKRETKNTDVRGWSISPSWNPKEKRETEYTGKWNYLFLY
ncbi:hypothetical protein NDU88_006279 [Pleurodeles waltl]|uniref:Uncharacterized protein n=1 Tax=Pleurodeles waltl TaxID=8319 RepID=A0AAV7TWR7_PLEWA|nr:hypothetical protein NDU88_006279 [Pleurodeles waltl]